MTIDSRTLMEATGLPEATLRWWADRLPLPKHGQRGRARVFSVADAVMVLFARQLVDDGMSEAAAIEITRALAPELPAFLTEKWPEIFLCARRNAETGQFEVEVDDDPVKALATSVAWDRAGGRRTHLFSVRPMLEQAVRQLVDARRQRLGMQPYAGPTDLRALTAELDRLTGAGAPQPRH